MGFGGAAALAIGLFVPIATVPILGSVTLMSSGFNLIGMALLVTAGLSAFLAWADREDDLVWTGAAALLTVIFVFGRLQLNMMRLRESLETELKDNPFAGLAQSAAAAMGVQWGWLVLAAGAAVLLYAGVQSRKQREVPLLRIGDRFEWGVVAVSAITALVAPVQSGWSLFSTPPARPAMPAGTAAVPPTSSTVQTDASTAGQDAEAKAYIAQSLKVYDFKARKYDTYEGATPGVDFKIKNSGARTIKRLELRVVFFDDQDKPIAEETFYPVSVGSFSMGNENKPLRPNYIWQQEDGKFYTAKSVPSEWKVGNAKAEIVSVEFE